MQCKREFSLWLSELRFARELPPLGGVAEKLYEIAAVATLLRNDDKE